MISTKQVSFCVRNLSRKFETNVTRFIKAYAMCSKSSSDKFIEAIGGTYSAVLVKITFDILPFKVWKNTLCKD